MVIFFPCGCPTSLLGDLCITSKCFQNALNFYWLQPESSLYEEYRVVWFMVWEGECWMCSLGMGWVNSRLFGSSKLQNWLLLLETPADLASAIDTVFIARHEELHNAASRTVPIIAIHCMILLSSTRYGTDPQTGGEFVRLTSNKFICGAGVNTFVHAAKIVPLNFSKKERKVCWACAEGAHLGSCEHNAFGFLKSTLNSVLLWYNFPLCISKFQPVAILTLGYVCPPSGKRTKSITLCLTCARKGGRSEVTGVSPDTSSQQGSHGLEEMCRNLQNCSAC